MDNKIIFYDNQSIDCFLYSSKPLKLEEETSFNIATNLDWDDFSNAKIICNFTNGLASSYLSDISDKITGFEILKKLPEENFARRLGIFSISELNTYRSSKENMYSLVDYNIKNNQEYTYFVSPLTENFIQSTLQAKVLTNWDIYSLTPIYYINENKYGVIKDELGNTINWIFQLNCSEGDIVLNQDKTIFTTFANKPKISLGDLNYYTGKLSCLLGNVLYNDQYYEPNILLDKWDKMIKEKHIYLFKNPKGDSMIISLEDGTKKTYMNEAANYYLQSYNDNIAITNRPTTIEFSYIEIADSEKIQIYGD